MTRRATVSQLCHLCDRAIAVGDLIDQRSGQWCHTACVSREVGE